MGMRFAWHACGKALNIKQDLAGKRGICPACRVRFRIPTEDTETSPPIDSAAPAEQPRVEDQPPKAPQPADEIPQAPAKLPESSNPISSMELLSSDPKANWYVRPPSGGQYGPATGDVLHQWIDEGRVAAKSLLWRDGWPQWREAEEAIPELIGSLPAKGDSFGYEETPFSQRSAAKRVAVTQEHPAPDSRQEDSSSQSLAGSHDIGKTRRARSLRRAMILLGLAILAIILLVVLIYVATRGG